MHIVKYFSLNTWINIYHYIQCICTFLTFTSLTLVTWAWQVVDVPEFDTCQNGSHLKHPEMYFYRSLYGSRSQPMVHCIFMKCFDPSTHSSGFSPAWVLIGILSWWEWWNALSNCAREWSFSVWIHLWHWKLVLWSNVLLHNVHWDDPY